MSVDVKDIGTFGISFSKDFDQTWFNVWRKDGCFSVDFHQDVETDGGDDDPIASVVEASIEEGEALLQRILDEGRIDEWQASYTADDEGMETDQIWTLDIDDPSEADLFFSSGNGKLPPRALTMGALEAIRTAEPRFATCFPDLR